MQHFGKINFAITFRVYEIEEFYDFLFLNLYSCPFQKILQLYYSNRLTLVIVKYGEDLFKGFSWFN